MNERVLNEIIMGVLFLSVGSHPSTNCCVLCTTTINRKTESKRFNNVIITGRAAINVNNNEKGASERRKTIGMRNNCVECTLGHGQGNEVERHDSFFSPNSFSCICYLTSFSLSLSLTERIEFKLFSNFFTFFVVVVVVVALPSVDVFPQNAIHGSWYASDWHAEYEQNDFIMLRNLFSVHPLVY